MNLEHCLLLRNECIEVNPLKRGGIPVLKGTRFTVSQVLAEIAEGRSILDIAADFDLSFKCLKNLLHGFAICFDHPIKQTEIDCFDSQQIAESIAAYKRGEFQSAEDILHELLQGDSPITDKKPD